jgi:hypothetical protein
VKVRRAQKKGCDNVNKVVLALDVVRLGKDNVSTELYKLAAAVLINHLNEQETKKETK